MRDATSKLLAAALAQASLKIAEEGQHGRLQWKRGDTRLYGADRDGCAVLTFVRRGAPVVQYEIVGVSFADLS